jgi:long-subunit acyl-CoA synthetase (AMP-forming)
VEACARYPRAIVGLRTIAQGLKEQHVFRGFDTISDENRLKGYEKIKRAHIAPEELSLENGCLTSSLKLATQKRRAREERVK